MPLTAAKFSKTEETTLTDIREVLYGVRIIDPISRTDLVCDLTMENGLIVSIVPSRGAPSGLWLLPGLVDMHVHLRVPGGEDSETLESGLRAAIAGGVTHVGMMPNTTPPVDSPAAALEIASQGNRLNLAEIHPVPCVTVGRAGLQCTDLEAFAAMGIKAFTDDGSPVRSDRVLSETFARLSPVGGVVIEHPEIEDLASGGAVNLGRASEVTGAKGIPEEAEYLDVKRCINLLRRSGTSSRLHLTHLSSPESVRLVHQASREGLHVTCDITPHHMSLDENDLITLGSIAKMNPPLRSPDSRNSLVALASKGQVDVVASDHAPHRAESKNLPVQDAAFGITGLETLLPITVDVLVNSAGMAPLEVVRMLSSAPADVLGLKLSGIKVGVPPEMVLFDPDRKWTYESTFSMSANSPYLGREIRGRVVRVWAGKELYRDGEFV